jgi:hypothetical protein
VHGLLLFSRNLFVRAKSPARALNLLLRPAILINSQSRLAASLRLVASPLHFAPIAATDAAFQLSLSLFSQNSKPLPSETRRNLPSNCKIMLTLCLHSRNIL